MLADFSLVYVFAAIDIFRRCAAMPAAMPRYAMPCHCAMPPFRHAAMMPPFLICRFAAIFD
jgi:hypothetical protein